MRRFLRGAGAVGLLFLLGAWLAAPALHDLAVHGGCCPDAAGRSFGSADGRKLCSLFHNLAAESLDPGTVPPRIVPLAESAPDLPHEAPSLRPQRGADSRAPPRRS
jgi:hypothetical protein